MPQDTVDDDGSQRKGCWMTVKIFFACLGVILGITTFFIFTFLYGNIHAGLWALASSILSSIVLHLHLLYRNQRLNSWHTLHSLAANRNLGVLALLGSLGAMVYYFYTAVSEHQEVYPIKDSWLIAGVWAFMSVKWSLGLTFYGHKYMGLLDREYSLM
jgi:cation transport ATPase